MNKNIKLLISILIAVLAAIFASQHPDGLDKISQSLGFATKGTEHSAAMAGYAIPFLGQTKLSTVIAGIAGVLITYGLFLGGIFAAKKVWVKEKREE